MSYTPDPRPRIQKAQRFFARLASFDLECPACGDVYQIRQGNSRRNSLTDPNWDPVTARFTCTNKGCGKVYVLGILAWPIIPAPFVASTPPADQIPSPRQVAMLRKEGGGWWMAEEDGVRYKTPLETNLTTETDRAENDDDD